MKPRIVIDGSRRHRALQCGGIVVAGAVALLPPLLLADYRVGQFALVIAYAVAVLGLNVLTGFSGQVSLGHGAFFGLGAYTSAILFTDHGWPFLATLPVSALLGLALGFLVGIPALRLTGLYLAVVTLAIGVAFPVVITQPAAEWLGSGGVTGKTVFIRWDKPGWFGLNVSDLGWKYVVMAAVAAALFFLATGLVRGRPGRSLVALRDNETAAAVSGIWPAEVKTVAFAVSAMYGALGGSLYVLVTPVVSPAGIGFSLTLLFITAMVLGGANTVAGAWIGGLAMVFLPHYTAQWAGDIGFLSDLTDQPGLFSNVVYGLILILFVYFLPRGLAPFLTAVRTRLLVIVPRAVAGTPAVAAAGSAPRRPGGEPARGPAPLPTGDTR